MQVRLTYILSNLIWQESQCYPAWWSKIKSQQGRRGWFAIRKNGLSHMLFAKLFTNILSLIFWNKKLFSRKVFTLWRCIEVQTTLAKVTSTKPYWIHTTFDKTILYHQIILNSILNPHWWTNNLLGPWPWPWPWPPKISLQFHAVLPKELKPQKRSCHRADMQLTKLTQLNSEMFQ